MAFSHKLGITDSHGYILWSVMLHHQQLLVKSLWSESMIAVKKVWIKQGMSCMLQRRISIINMDIMRKSVVESLVVVGKK